jgi:hypothetical protein
VKWRGCVVDTSELPRKIAHVGNKRGSAVGKSNEIDGSWNEDAKTLRKRRRRSFMPRMLTSRL